MACTVMNGFSRPEPDAAAAPDAEVDAEAAAEAGAEAEAGPVNLIPNGDFEQGCGLAPWGPYDATVTDSNIARSGTHACLVCAAGAVSFYTLDEPVGSGFVQDPLLGQTYFATAWVRTPPGTPSGQTSYIDERVRDASGNGVGFGQSTPAVTLSDSTWQPLSVSYTVNVSNGAWLNVYIEADNAVAGDCFLLDDVSLYLR
jgi:hypothetical protein